MDRRSLSCVAYSVGVLGVLIVTAWLMGCEEALLDEFEEGPTLVVEVPQEDLRTEPTNPQPQQATDPPLLPEQRCCCRVVGRVINRSTVAVHVTVTVKAFNDIEAEPIGTAVDFMKDIQPEEEREIAATGLLFPCAEITRLELEDVDVRGIWFP